MNNQVFYARTIPDNDDPASWQTLEEHLRNTAERAAGFCRQFPWNTWAHIAGMLHDTGKIDPAFQRRLFDNSIRFTHSTGGAVLAERMYPDLGSKEHFIARILGYVIAGHHAGLPDLYGGEASLKKRIQNDTTDFSGYAVEELVDPPCSLADLESLFGGRDTPADTSFGLAFFIRMLFSCLVDADRLDSEAFAAPEKASLRGNYPPLKILKQRLDRYLNHLSNNNPELPINTIRAGILAECRKAAGNEPGVFSLTVPTGGGKTLSSLAFALEHALANNLDRVIYVIPYTSIIEQNAAVFRSCLGEESVVEHHSNFDAAGEDENSPRRLASENWDAPVIVTTNVQFFESLFSHHPGRCRKLHNIMNSVVILDEAQMLPPSHLRPCLGALKELSERYNTTVVVCTATQPALHRDPEDENGYRHGFNHITEIISDRDRLYERLKRVTIHTCGKLADNELAARCVEHQQLLCIVNTKQRARETFASLSPHGDTFHLSSAMYPQHRRKRLEEVKKRLREKHPCRLISTQVVEAGVDIDFPVVYREIAGIDSIAQAAGRCNREGLLDTGEVFIFEPERVAKLFSQQSEAARYVFDRHQDVLSLPAVREYFLELYWARGDRAADSLDMYRRLEERLGRDIAFPLRTLGKEFHLIDDDSVPVIIQCTENEHLIEKLRREDADISVLRQLQQYTVTVYRNAFTELEQAGAVENVNPCDDRFHILMAQYLYDENVGLRFDDPTYRNPNSLYY